MEDGRAFADVPTPQLCGLWRKSLSGLHAAVDPVDRLRVVQAREALLAELERRAPDAMADWLSVGGADPDGPSAYLLGPVGPGSRDRS